MPASEEQELAWTNDSLKTKFKTIADRIVLNTDTRLNSFDLVLMKQSCSCFTLSWFVFRDTTCLLGYNGNTDLFSRLDLSHASF